MAKRPKKTTGSKKKAVARKPSKLKKASARKAAPKKNPSKKAPLKKVRAKKTTAKAIKGGTRPRMIVITVPQHITLDLPPVLHDRLKALSKHMDMPMEAVMRQALTEFADTWEDHHRTMGALAEGSDRMQLVVKD